MKLLVTLFPFVLLSITSANPTHRVVGGIDAYPHEFPYQISIQYNGTHHCGGSILNEYYILTAAHCAKPANATLVIAGGHNLQHFNGHEQVRRIEEFINHEEATDEVGPYDIALIKVTEPFVLNEFVQPIALPKSRGYPSGDAVLSGWGSTSQDLDPIYPEVLQKAVMPIHAEDLCFRCWENGPYHHTNICAGDLSGHNSVCSGDSGGPLAQKVENETVIVGVVSWGLLLCGVPAKPGVFTSVSLYNDWILEHMQ